MSYSKEEISSAIAKRLKEARKEERLSQEALAKKVNVSNSSILRWENEKAMIPVDCLLRISAALNRPISYFLQDVSEEMKVSAGLSEQWLSVLENGDRSEMGVRLKDLVEKAPSCEIYVGLTSPKSD